MTRVGQSRSRLAAAGPARSERDGYCRRLHWTVGIDTVESLATAVPDRLYRLWSHVGVLGTTALIASWVVLAILLVGLGVTRGLEPAVLSATVPPAPPTPGPGDLIAAVGIGILAYGLYVAIFLALIPGMLVHELGHALAATRHGGTIESYGVVLVGPLPVGAFVRWRLDEPPAEHRAHVEVAAGGIANNLCLAGIFLCAAVLVAAASGGLAIPGGLGDLTVTTAFVVVLVCLAALEVGTAWLNAAPLLGLDGALYRDAVVRAALVRWWGFDRPF